MKRYTSMYGPLKASSAVFFSHHIVQVFRSPKTLAGSNPTGGLTIIFNFPILKITQLNSC